VDKIIERLQKDVPKPQLESVVETIIYRLGKRVADRNRAINEVNAASLFYPIIME
jgi:hypothetical protein